VKKYIFGRVLQALLVLWGAYTVTYIILYLLPSDPLSIMLTASGVEMDTLSPAQLAKARAYYGLDQGAVEQYLSLLWRALHGDFGQSPTGCRRPCSFL
jgi:peptide/nickel transport system permease protein